MNEKIKKNLKTIRNIYLYFKITSTIIKHAGLLAQNTEHKIELIDIKELNSLNQYTSTDFLELNIFEPIYIHINLVYFIPKNESEGIPEDITIPIIYYNKENKLYIPELNISIEQSPEDVFIVKPKGKNELNIKNEYVLNKYPLPYPLKKDTYPYTTFYIEPINVPISSTERPNMQTQKYKAELTFKFKVDLNEIKQYINQISTSEILKIPYTDKINSLIDTYIKNNNTSEEEQSYKLIVVIIGNNVINFMSKINNFIQEKTNVIQNKHRIIKLKYSVSLFILAYLYLLPEVAPSLEQYIDLLANEEEKQLFINTNTVDGKIDVNINNEIYFDSPYHIYKIRDVYLNEYILPKRTRRVKKRKLTLSSSFYRVMYALRSLGLIQIIDEKSLEYKYINDFFKSKTFENTIDKVFIKLTEKDIKGFDTINSPLWFNPIEAQRKLGIEKPFEPLLKPPLKELPETLKKKKIVKNPKNPKKKQTNKPKQRQTKRFQTS